ncbi:hypothetical protein HN51_009603 [Arachis hypogaea]
MIHLTVSESVNPSRPVAFLRRRGLGSSATAVAWSSALVTLHRRLLASSSSSRGPQQPTPVALHRRQLKKLERLNEETLMSQKTS